MFFFNQRGGAALLLLMVLLMAGCTGNHQTSGETGGGAGTAGGGPLLTLEAGTLGLTGYDPVRLDHYYRDGISAAALLQSSGLATFAPDGQHIASVSGVSLGEGIVWQLSADGKPIGAKAWDEALSPQAQLILTAKREDEAAGQGALVVLTVSGGSGHPELNHSYVMAYAEDLTVRKLLQGSGAVSMSENGMEVRSAGGHGALPDERWRMKVNGKYLTDGGIDMMLRPLDELELVLALR